MANGALLDDCGDHNGYAANDLKKGDTISIYVCIFEEEYYALKIALKRRENALVPPCKKFKSAELPYHDYVNFINKLEDGGTLSTAEEIKYKLSEKVLQLSGYKVVAARLYDNGKLKPIEDQVPKPKANADDKTLKAPSATTLVKDKPPTEKK